MSRSNSVLSKRRADNLLRRVYRVLRSGDWSLRLSSVGDDPDFRRRHGVSNRAVGLCTNDEKTGDGVIYVHFREPLITVIVHECLHAAYPDWNELEVRFGERLIMRHLTPRQATALMFLAVSRLR